MKGRGSSAASARSTRSPTPDQLAGRFHQHHHRVRRAGSRSPTTRFPRRAFHGSRSSRCATGGTRRPTAARRKETIRPSGRCPECQPVHHSRRSGSRQAGASVRTIHQVAVQQQGLRKRHRHWRPGVRAGHHQLAGLPHLALSKQHRQPVPSRAGRRAGGPERHRVSQGDVDFLHSTGTFTGLPDAQRECPSIGIQGSAGTGGAVNAYSASNQPMWDLSNPTTWMTGVHVEFRRELPEVVAAAGPRHGIPRQLRVQRRLHRKPGGGHAAGYYSTVGIFQPASFSVPGAPGNPREFNFKYFAPYFQDDWRVSSRLTMNLGLRWDYRNVPYETRNRMAWRNLD